MIRIPPPFSSSTSMAHTNNQELQENQSKDMDKGKEQGKEKKEDERGRRSSPLSRPIAFAW